jgi:hypothetical protein
MAMVGSGVAISMLLRKRAPRYAEFPLCAAALIILL